MRECKSLGLEEARLIVEAGIKAAQETGERPMSIAVVDRHGQPVCLMRMDGIGGTTVHMALAKCYTAIGTLRDTIEFREVMSKGNIASYEFPIPNITTIPGGVLVKTKDGTVVGAVGTSGRAPLGPGSDEEIARAAAAAFVKTEGFGS
jgi:uncharacterized protein GlcG (DUF336 family)